jgi:hypothetical protein
VKRRSQVLRGKESGVAGVQELQNEGQIIVSRLLARNRAKS